MPSGRPTNEARQTAIELGLNTYTGTTHRRCGTDQRYTAGGACIHCARLRSAAQRGARILIKDQNEADETPLDNAAQDGLEIDEEAAAEARRQASFDDLM